MDLKKNVKKKILFLSLYMMETSFLKQNLEVTQMRSVVSLPTDTLVNSQLTGTNWKDNISIAGYIWIASSFAPGSFQQSESQGT